MEQKKGEYTSSVLDEILGGIPSKDSGKARYKMLLAANIDDAINEKGWNKSEFARRMNQQPSVVSKWLSGTHNFTTDTLFEIGKVLDKVFNPFEEPLKDQLKRRLSESRTELLKDVPSEIIIGHFGKVDFHQDFMKYIEPVKPFIISDNTTEPNSTAVNTFRTLRTFKYDHEKTDPVNINELQWQTQTKTNSYSLLVN